MVFRVSRCARYCGQEGAGAYQADAVQAGITEVLSRSFVGGDGVLSPLAECAGGVVVNPPTGGPQYGVPYSPTVAGRYVYKTTQRTADKTRPENVALPVALYLGRPAQI